jgi:hypothetical protein
MTRRILLLALALGTASCEIKASPVQFAAICLPPTTCAFEAKCGLQFIGENRLDLNLLPATEQDYTLFVEIHNQAQNNANVAGGQINTQDASLRELVIDYEGVNLPGTTTRLQQSVPASGTAVIGIQAVDAAGVSALRGVVTGTVTSAVVVAKVKGKGVFGDGTSFETSTWEIPFRACRNCTDTCTVVASGCPHVGQHPFNCTQ